MLQECFSIDELDGYQFEDLVAKIMKKQGYRNIQVTNRSGDFGKDIIMEDSLENIVIIECKHQKNVGRPVIQKLQGAMQHEEKMKPNRNIYGIVVTSGSFSREAIKYGEDFQQNIELIDGRKLSEICKDLNIVVLNGKIQILTDNSFKNISNENSINRSLEAYSKIYGNKFHEPAFQTRVTFIPCCFFEYEVVFTTSTSVGVIDKYYRHETITIDGITKNLLDENLSHFYFSDKAPTEKINNDAVFEKIPFEFTENDAEDYVIQYITDKHSHNVSYTGKNNVTYTKMCTPGRRDINILKFKPVYLPNRSNIIKILDQEYNQNFFSKGESTHYIIDDLRKCIICNKIENNYENLSICIECAGIACKKHIKIDYWDKETPICMIHVKPFKLWLQTRYFAFDVTKGKYENYWNQKTFFQKMKEDEIALILSVAIFILIFIGILIMLFGS
jgi:restriction system protein